MISLDTNILVRIFVDDSGQTDQSKKARQSVAKYKTVYVSQTVQIEMVWVLNRAYKFSRKEVGFVLENLLNNQSFRLENESIFAAALLLYCSSNIDFSDAVILQTSLRQNLKLLSFDKKLQKQQGVVVPV